MQPIASRNRRQLSVLLLLMFTLVLAFGTPARAADKVRLNTSKKTICIGKSLKLQVKGASGKVTWESGDPSVASVSSKGKITAKKSGKTTVTAKTGQKKLACVVTVKKHSFVNGKCQLCGSTEKAKKESASALVPIKELDRYSYFRKYMTDAQFKKAYKAASKIVKPLLGKSKEDQLLGIAVGLRELFDSSMSYSMSASHYNDPYGYLVLKSASCAGCARATGLCLNMLGFKYEHINENKYSHQWARVKLGKTYWICDAYGLYCGPEPAAKKHPYF